MLLIFCLLGSKACEMPSTCAVKRLVFASLCRRRLSRLKNPMLDQFVNCWSSLQFLLEGIGTHLLVKSFLVCLKTRCSTGVWKDVSCVKDQPE